MQRVIPLPLAVYGSLALLSATVLMHFCILTGLLPRDIVWGGKAVTAVKFYMGETISIMLNLWFGCVILGFTGKIKMRLSPKFLRGWLQSMTIIFLLNTLGNLLAENPLERWLFTPVTVLLAIFCFRMVRSGKPKAAAAQL